MAKLLLWFFVLTIFLSIGVSAICEDGQIDINSASIEELDQLYGIGPVKAQAIVDSKPFSSVDDLIRVNGIGEVTLENIKSQGLACVAEDENVIKEKDNEESSSNVTETASASDIKIENSSKETQLETINLNPQAIKTENSENVDNNYAIYGFILFSIIIIALFALKNRRKKRNELK